METINKSLGVHPQYSPQKKEQTWRDLKIADLFGSVPNRLGENFHHYQSNREKWDVFMRRPAIEREVLFRMYPDENTLIHIPESSALSLYVSLTPEEKKNHSVFFANHILQKSAIAPQASLVFRALSQYVDWDLYDQIDQEKLYQYLEKLTEEAQALFLARWAFLDTIKNRFCNSKNSTSIETLLNLLKKEHNLFINKEQTISFFIQDLFDYYLENSKFKECVKNLFIRKYNYFNQFDDIGESRSSLDEYYEKLEKKNREWIFAMNGLRYIYKKIQNKDFLSILTIEEQKERFKTDSIDFFEDKKVGYNHFLSILNEIILRITKDNSDATFYFLEIAYCCRLFNKEVELRQLTTWAKENFQTTYHTHAFVLDRPHQSMGVGEIAHETLSGAKVPFDEPETRSGEEGIPFDVMKHLLSFADVYSLLQFRQTNKTYFFTIQELPEFQREMEKRILIKMQTNPLPLFIIPPSSAFDFFARLSYEYTNSLFTFFQFLLKQENSNVQNNSLVYLGFPRKIHMQFDLFLHCPQHDLRRYLQLLSPEAQGLLLARWENTYGTLPLTVYSQAFQSHITSKIIPEKNTSFYLYSIQIYFDHFIEIDFKNATPTDCFEKKRFVYTRLLAEQEEAKVSIHDHAWIEAMNCFRYILWQVSGKDEFFSRSVTEQKKEFYHRWAKIFIERRFAYNPFQNFLSKLDNELEDTIQLIRYGPELASFYACLGEIGKLNATLDKLKALEKGEAFKKSKQWKNRIQQWPAMRFFLLKVASEHGLGPKLIKKTPPPQKQQEGKRPMKKFKGPGSLDGFN